MTEDLGLIVGSGFAYLSIPVLARRGLKTPYGKASSQVLTIELGGRRIPCLARHGEAQSIGPHEVNYRANVWALHESGVRRCVALNVVGAIAAAFGPGDLAVPDQLIDYSWGRDWTYSGNGKIEHIDFTEPFDPVLRGRIAEAAAACGFRPRAGVYGVTQGPRLETAAEIDRLERDGCAMVGMTAMPEAALARELGMDYAILAVAVNYAAGRSPTGAPIHGQIEQCLRDGMRRIAIVLDHLFPGL